MRWLSLLALAVVGCAEDPPAPPVDAVPVDAGPVDAGPVDAGPVDAGPVDAGRLDAGRVDAAAAHDALAPDAAPQDPLACNGARHLCDRPLPEVAFAMGHNAHAVDPPFSRLAANQHLSVAEQLARGARGLGIKLYYSDDRSCGPLGLYAWHGFPRLGCVPFAEVAAPVAEFLASHPREVLVITVEGDAPAAQVRAGLAAAGLEAWRSPGPAPGAPWPSLGALIEADTRLVVLRAGGGEGLPDLWQTVQDTPYDFQDRADFACHRNRGPQDAPWFLLNHFLTRLSPVPAEAAEINAWPVLGQRILDCAETRGLPSLVYVDFLGAGDTLAIVDTLNGPGELEARLARLAAEVAARTP